MQQCLCAWRYGRQRGDGEGAKSGSVSSESGHGSRSQGCICGGKGTLMLPSAFWRTASCGSAQRGIKSASILPAPKGHKRNEKKKKHQTRMGVRECARVQACVRTRNSRHFVHEEAQRTHTHAHTHTHACTHARMHTHTHTRARAHQGHQLASRTALSWAGYLQSHPQFQTKP